MNRSICFLKSKTFTNLRPVLLNRYTWDIELQFSRVKTIKSQAILCTTYYSSLFPFAEINQEQFGQKVRRIYRVKAMIRAFSSRRLALVHAVTNLRNLPPCSLPQEPLFRFRIRSYHAPCSRFNRILFMPKGSESSSHHFNFYTVFKIQFLCKLLCF